MVNLLRTSFGRFVSTSAVTLAVKTGIICNSVDILPFYGKQKLLKRTNRNLSTLIKIDESRRGNLNGKFVRTVHSLGGNSEDTIYALATPVGRGAIAVIRISGAGSSQILSSFTARKELPSPRRATVRTLIDPTNQEILDNAVVLWFPGPASYTGEDTVELHVHGGAAVVDGIISSLAKHPSLRLASPGEFTRRALLNGKLDLIEAEGLADLLLVCPQSPLLYFRKQLGLCCQSMTSLDVCRQRLPPSAAPHCAR
jgi:hypothetical protein